MIRKILVFAIGLSTAASATSAQTPEPKRDAERAARVMSWQIDGPGGYMGVQTIDVNAENFAAFGLSAVRGVSVDKVVEGSPAEKAGIRAGDVILRFNGEDVTSARKLTRLVGEVAPDHQVNLTIFRNGSEREITLTMGKRPMPVFGNGAFAIGTPGAPGNFEFRFPDFPNLPGELPNVQGIPLPKGDGGDVLVFRGMGSRQIGVGVVGLTRQLSEYFNVKGGVLVNNVRPDSPAFKAGLKAGDIIVEVDRKEISNDIELIRAISEKKDGDVEVTYVRGGNRQTVKITPEEVKGGFDRMWTVPEAPNSPDRMRLARPGNPIPLNQLMVPGRIL